MEQYLSFNFLIYQLTVAIKIPVYVFQTIGAAFGAKRMTTGTKSLVVGVWVCSINVSAIISLLKITHFILHAQVFRFHCYFLAVSGHCWQ